MNLPFCVRPVTWSHLFGTPLGRVLGGCAESFPGAGESASVEDWAYIRPAVVDEPPFCVRPVTRSHLFGPPLGRELGGCAENSPNAGESAGVEDWAYIPPAVVDEPPFCVRPVTGSHLFGPPLGRVLGGCAENSPGAGESTGAEDWGYIVRQPWGSG